jgi:hypothetical protein
MCAWWGHMHAFLSQWILYRTQRGRDSHTERELLLISSRVMFGTVNPMFALVNALVLG